MASKCPGRIQEKETDMAVPLSLDVEKTVGCITVNTPNQMHIYINIKLQRYVYVMFVMFFNIIFMLWHVRDKINIVYEAQRKEW